MSHAEAILALVGARRDRLRVCTKTEHVGPWSYGIRYRECKNCGVIQR